jgi:hypothetical protein
MALIVWKLDLQLPVQSVLMTTKVVSLIPVHGEVYSMQLYILKDVPFHIAFHKFRIQNSVSITAFYLHIQCICEQSCFSTASVV